MEHHAAEAANELELGELLPRAMRRDGAAGPPTTRPERSAIAGRIMLAVATLILGNALLSAAVAGMAVVAKSSAALGSPLTFPGAFILTFPLSVLVAGLMWLASTERLHAFEIAAFGVLGAVGVTYAAGLGIDDTTMAEMLASARSLGGSWFVQTFGIIGEYLTYYTWVPFLGGIVTGYAMGAICVRLAHFDRE